MSKRILVIDDEPEVLQMLYAVLLTKGHDVITAEGGQEGLDAAHEEDFDLIIVDLMMPRVSGLEVIKQLKKNEDLRSIPVIVLSSLDDDERRPREFWIRSLNVDDYVNKPFDPLDIMGRVEYILRRSTYVSSGNKPQPAEPPQPTQAAPSASSRGRKPPSEPNDTDTRIPVDLKEVAPKEIVQIFVESWNSQNFAVEYQCLSDDLLGSVSLQDYVSDRRQTYLEEKGKLRRQKVVRVIQEKVSLNMARVTVLREDKVAGEISQFEESYVLKKTFEGWKIVNYRKSEKE